MSITIGIIREGKSPPDARTPLTPFQCAQLQQDYGITVLVQNSPIRCFSDEEYAQHQITLTNDLTSCDVLMGVKEVPIEQLIPHKTYCFFSHTIKEQQHNKPLLRAILEKDITLLDYELMVDEHHHRVIAFGFFAGMVGAHNALYTYGQRTKSFNLPRLYSLNKYEEVLPYYNELEIPPLKIVVTGTGRVGQGARKVLLDIGLIEVTPEKFLNESFQEPIFTVLRSSDYVQQKNNQPFTYKSYYRNPSAFYIDFSPYYRQSQIFINCIYWDNRAPAFFTQQEMASNDFNIEIIADITCDIAPLSSIPSTLRPSTIPQPIYGFDPLTGKETEPYNKNNIDVMAVDNLPGELPRDASEAFGNQVLKHLIPALVQPSRNKMLQKATITNKGSINPLYPRLIHFVQEP